MTGEVGTGARGRGGAGWTLAPLGQGPVDPSRTLASLGVLDGDQLVLRRRADAAPPPLFDDVVDAVAEATPASYRAWGPGLAARPRALRAGARARGRGARARRRRPGSGHRRRGSGTAASAGVAALGALAAAAVCTRVVDGTAAGSVLAAGAVALAGVAGVAAVPWGAAGPAASLAATAGRPAAAARGGPRRGRRRRLAPGAGPGRAQPASPPCSAPSPQRCSSPSPRASPPWPTRATPRASPPEPARSPSSPRRCCPRTGIALARLPLPRVPASAEELADDPGVAEHADIERRADRAHAALSGLVLGCGAVTAGAVTVLALAPVGGWRGVAGWALAVLLDAPARAALAHLRQRRPGRRPARLRAARGRGAGRRLAARRPAGRRACWPCRRSPSPRARWASCSVSWSRGGGSPRWPAAPSTSREAVGIAAVLPVALAVMDLYTAMRLL